VGVAALDVSMADFRTAWAPATYPTGGDWLAAPPGLAADHDLETAVLLSLFTDASAGPDDELPDRTDDRRGWWGNWEAPEELPIGSRLWLLARAASTEETRQRAEEYAAEALAWLLDDDPTWGRVAARVDVAAEWLEVGPVPPSTLALQIRITRADGAIYDRRYAWAWEQLTREGLG
jgi:phage gp46-like protein